MVACTCKLSILGSEAVKLLAPIQGFIVSSRTAWAKTQSLKHIKATHKNSVLQR
ncbi:hypothetical protein I79_004082 [Cricetulus griseus]|uniref:Uncharacterized protein n=1 Tax=Cricetulus griseus TaxID=10029 RepID=G3H1Q0_CRIGR|nr:hypothetical protein I79_004082 [Cricetulus griseus]